MSHKQARRIAAKVMQYLDSQIVPDEGGTRWEDLTVEQRGGIRDSIEDIIFRVCWEGEK